MAVFQRASVSVQRNGLGMGKRTGNVLRAAQLVCCAADGVKWKQCHHQCVRLCGWQLVSPRTWQVIPPSPEQLDCRILEWFGLKGL